MGACRTHPGHFDPDHGVVVLFKQTLPFSIVNQGMFLIQESVFSVFLVLGLPFQKHSHRRVMDVVGLKVLMAPQGVRQDQNLVVQAGLQ